MIYLMKHEGTFLYNHPGLAMILANVLDLVVPLHPPGKTWIKTELPNSFLFVYPM
jgi:hypothetical protein